MCGEILVSMYGTRTAANNWQKFYTKVLLDNGFKRTRACTCTFRHTSRDIDLVVHGDDFISTGDGEDLQWLRMLFETKFEISTNVIGHEAGDDTQLKVLNRIISVKENAYTYEPDARHAEIVIRELGLQEAKAVTTPVAEFRPSPAGRVPAVTAYETPGPWLDALNTVDKFSGVP